MQRKRAWEHYLIALGSNVRHHRHGRPEQVLKAALRTLGEHGIVVERTSPIIRTAPLGPSRRRYANAAAVIHADLGPDALLGILQQVEQAFGRRRGHAQRWSARVLDLDIVLWKRGTWRRPGLTIPHPEFRRRAFVLLPAREVAAGWRDPLTGRSVRQLAARLTRPRPCP